MQVDRAADQDGHRDQVGRVADGVPDSPEARLAVAPRIAVVLSRKSGECRARAKANVYSVPFSVIPSRFGLAPNR